MAKTKHLKKTQYPKQTKHYSYCEPGFNMQAKGCKLCVQGKKLVLFVTGICPRNCFYCTLSEKKKNKDVVYANEWPTSDIKKIIKEAELCKAEGAGITGGDPLARLERTLSYIRALKKHFGKKFHIHLYTSLDLITAEKLEKLYKAGLDEIRFHPDLNNRKQWPKLKKTMKFSWDIGVEIPVIPDYKIQLKYLISTIAMFNLTEKNKIKFLNLNEFEYSDSFFFNAKNSSTKKYTTRNSLTYAIKGSHELALELVRYIKHNNIHLNVHYCTAKLKDAVQLKKRLILRAKSVKKKFDKIDKEGMIIRGAIYLNETFPSFGYRKKLEQIKNSRTKLKKVISKLEKTKKELENLLGLKKEEIEIDKLKLRLITSVKNARLAAKKTPEKKDKAEQQHTNQKKNIKQHNFKAAIVKEYPSYDQLEIELTEIR